MTCKDCIHYDACKNAAYDYAGENTMRVYDDDKYCKIFAENCVNFSNKSEWFHFYAKDYKTVYYPLGHGNKAQVIEEPIYGLAIKNGKRCIIDECGDFYEIGEEVFLTKEEAQKVVERRKTVSCKDCIHCSACMHTRTATLDPYQSRPTNKDTGECSDWHSCYIQETKHSRWEYYNDTARCVNCDHYTNDAYFDEHDKIVLPRYCSNCGAKMDLEDNK